MSPSNPWRSVAVLAIAVCTTSALASACKGSDASGAGSSQPVASKPCEPLGDGALMVEFEAITADDHYVVTLVAVPTYPESAQRVFYGTAARMLEGTITGVSNRCARNVDFDVEGVSYTATFSQGACTNVEPGMFYVDLADGGFIGQRLTTIVASGGQSAHDGGVDPGALSYVCL